ncbi:hypothetical protein DB88DRAFT_474992 [Papiliotrema laurentii]|uniref:Uncharacterized protein n=1 Tax=Papiliotrema laurentii TaxID=5418 RepID=A0AAD9CWF1_PAPLA|nr:hypothetical protein DB88DRAFT_474992 [Papiliotrema laurentii]
MSKVQTPEDFYPPPSPQPGQGERRQRRRHQVGINPNSVRRHDHDPFIKEIVDQNAEYVRQQQEERRYPLPRRLYFKLTRVLKDIRYFCWLLVVFLCIVVWATCICTIFIPPAIILWLPWTYIGATRPRLWHAGSDGAYTAEVDYVHGITHLEDLFALPGEGIEDCAPEIKRKSQFFKCRTWQMYSLLRDGWDSLSRQGLQWGSVLSGFILIICQYSLMRHDLNSSAIDNFLQKFNSPGQDNAKLLTEGDPLCAYTVGTSIANWGQGKENLVWWGWYHSFLILLSLMLIVDETLNIRFGLFSPQWRRAGTGWTIIFLVTATFTSSPNWGTSDSSHKWRTIQLRYWILVAIGLLGVYNVCRTAVVALDLTTADFAKQDTRDGRKPLWPFRKEDWEREVTRNTFRIRVEGDEPRSVTEKLQLILGDRCWPYQKVDRKSWNYGMVRPRKYYDKTLEEKVIEQGLTSRRWVHSFPIDYPPLTKKDCRDMLRYSSWKNYAPWTGLAWYNPWDRWDPDENGNDLKAAQRAFSERKRWMFARYCSYAFDLRRMFTLACAVSAFALHIGLMCDAFVPGRDFTYRQAYNATLKDWGEHHGPRDDRCQYYIGTHVPILPKTGPWLSGLSLNMMWMILWHLFMLGLCSGVFLVALTNNRLWGMHLPVPITLIGPRLSSSSMGWTMGFIAVGTLQLGLFKSQPP